MGKLLRCWLAIELLPKNLGCLDDSRQIRSAIERHANGAALPRQRRQDRLTNPPHGVRDELHALVGIELPSRRQQTDVSFADEIDQGKAAVLIFLGDGDDETEVALDQLLQRVLISVANLAGELNFLVALQQRVGAYLIEVLIQNVAFRLVWSD